MATADATPAASPPTTCPECAGPVRDHGTESVCSTCGLVADEHPLDRGPEWRAFDSRARRRTGPPRTVTRHDRGLGSTIGHDDRDRRLPLRQRQAHRRARRGDKATRGRVFALGEVHRVTDALDLAGVVHETACQLFEQAQDAGLAKGRAYEGLVGAAVVASARIHGEPVTFDAVAAVTRYDADCGSFYRHYQRFVEALGVPVPPPDAATLVPGLVRELGLGERVRTAAERWCREYGDGLVGSGRKPSGVAAAAVYDAVGGPRNDAGVTQPDVADAAGVSPPTLRACWKAVDDG